MKKSAMVFFLAGTSALTAMPAFAQDAGAADGGLKEIVVTAQRREENLQKVPVAVTAIGADDLAQLRVTNIKDLQGLAPNLQLNTQGLQSNPTVTIRGVSSGVSNNAVDPKVGVYLDGVYIGRTVGSIFDLSDIARVEVLRGPQGTLYGRNTTGGAVNFITKKPSKDFHVTQKFGYQTYDGATSRTTVDTGELGDTGLSATASFLYKKIGGYYDNIAQPDKKDPGAENVRAGRIAINFDRGGKFRANYAFTHSASENGNIYGQLTAVSPLFASSVTQLPVISSKRRDEINLPTVSGHRIATFRSRFTILP